MPYIYCADCYCDACGKVIAKRLLSKADFKEWLNEEFWFESSDDGPKWMDRYEESDSPCHCGSLADCLDPIVLNDGSKIGALFGSLTSDGQAYVLKSYRKDPDSEVVQLWLKEFRIDHESVEIAKLRLSNDGTLPAYAWPGGYPITYLTSSGDVLCPSCANVADDVEAYDIFYEGPSEYCVECNTEIESAYGDPAEEQA